jgi:diguanylate cyclase (GGDEF)-like protein
VRLAHALANSSEPAEVAARVADALVDVGDVSFAAAYLVGEHGKLRLESRRGAPAPSASQPQLAAKAFASGTPVHAAARRDRPREVALPLVVGDDRLGVLLVGVAAEASPRTESLLATVADLTAVSMGSLRRAEDALSEARRDPLTGAGNRRAFYERLELMLDRTRRPAALALFDLDGLKEINDRSGHEAGDEVLRQVARRALATVRAADDVYRVGGDEFAVVVDGDADVAERVAHRVRVAMTAQRRGPALPTISVGIAAYPEHAVTPDDLMSNADAAMYAAKHAGGNKVVRA